MSIKTKFTDKGVRQMLALQAALQRESARVVIEVGLLAGGGGHADDPKKERKRPPKKAGAGKKPDERPAKPKKTLIDIANYHEFGLGVPQRSFLRSFSDERGEEVRANFRKISEAVARGWVKSQNTKQDVKYNRLGVWIVGQIKQRIGSGLAPALAASTVKRKGSSTPLIDTGQLRSAITYRIRDKSDAAAGAPAPRGAKAPRRGKAALKKARKGTVRKLRSVRKATAKFLKKAVKRK